MGALSSPGPPLPHPSLSPPHPPPDRARGLPWQTLSPAAAPLRWNPASQLQCCVRSTCAQRGARLKAESPATVASGAAAGRRHPQCPALAPCRAGRTSGRGQVENKTGARAPSQSLLWSREGKTSKSPETRGRSGPSRGAGAGGAQPQSTSQDPADRATAPSRAAGVFSPRFPFKRLNSDPWSLKLWTVIYWGLGRGREGLFFVIVTLKIYIFI